MTTYVIFQNVVTDAEKMSEYVPRAFELIAAAGGEANLLVLWVFTSKAKEARFLDLVRDHGGPGGLPILTTSLPQDENGSLSPGVWTQLFAQPWQRATGDPMLISNG